MHTLNPAKRVVLVDAMRGLALFGIIIIHCVENFGIFHSPGHRFLFSEEIDSTVTQYVFLIISGKAYSIFALLFGFSFYIQMDNHARRGHDYSWGFAWRLLVLSMIGFVNSLLYHGDILHIYAILGLSVILLNKLPSKVLLGISMFFALEPRLIFNIWASFALAGFQYSETFGMAYWGELNEINKSGSFWDVLTFNFWKGRAACWGWYFYSGRVSQLIALFGLGLWMGRCGKFHEMGQNLRFYLKLLVASLMFAGLLYIGNGALETAQFTDLQKGMISKLFYPFNGLAYTGVIISLFTIMYHYFQSGKVFNWLAAYGRMSLSNYVFQILLGVILYYGYGFGLYNLLGATWSLIMGLSILALQTWVSLLWFKKFHYGPLEWLWRVLTKRNFSIPLAKS